MAKENTTRYILLGLLRHNPMSGYDLKKRIDLSISQFWNVGYAQIYPTLGELEREGLVTKTTRDSAKGPARNEYAITESGERALSAWLLEPVAHEYIKYELLLKLFFGAGVPAENSRARIAAFRQQHEGELALLHQFRAELATLLDSQPDHLYYYLTVLFGERLYTAYQDWAEEALALLNARKPGQPLVTNNTPPSAKEEP